MNDWENNEEIKIFREYLRIPSVHPNINYGNWGIFLKNFLFWENYQLKIKLALKVKKKMKLKKKVSFNYFLRIAINFKHASGSWNFFVKFYRNLKGL